MADVKINVDFTKTKGKINPLHGVNNAPVLGIDSSLFHYMKEADIPFSRLHDTGFINKFVDICFIFPNFDADETLPESYDFAFTDVLIKELIKYGMEPFYRLGNTIENYSNVKAYNVYPPKDFKKWARIAEHIIMHYNEGWANGFHYGIKYFEVWFEPDVDFDPNNIAQTWHGTREEYFEFYDTVSNHLKNRFGDKIQIGGYASIGFKDNEVWDPKLLGVDPKYANKNCPWAYRIDYAHKFLNFVKERKCPLDYFSWHAYTFNMDDFASRIKFARRILDKYGFENIPSVLNEWNVCVGVDKQNRISPSVYRDKTVNIPGIETTGNVTRLGPEYRGTPRVVSAVLAAMITMQRLKVDIGCYYDARICSSEYCGLFNPYDLTPFKTYYAFKNFNSLYKLGCEVEAVSDDEDVFVLGARNEDKGVIVISNYSDIPKKLKLDTQNVPADEGEVIITDSEYTYTMLDKIIEDNMLTVKPYSCIEIRYNL